MNDAPAIDGTQKTPLDPRVLRLFHNLTETGYRVEEPSRSGSTKYTVTGHDGWTLRVSAAKQSDDDFRKLLEELRAQLEWTPSMAVEKRAMARWEELEGERARRRMIDPNWDEGAFERAKEHAEREVSTSKMVFEQLVVDDKMAFNRIIKHQVASELRGIDPQVAPDITALTSDNEFVRQRKLSGKRSDRLGQAMLSCEWMLTHQGVAFAWDDYCLDGQHRLEGIIRSGMPAALTLVSNVPDKTFAVIDTGKARTTGDVLTMMGVKGASAMGASLRLLHYYDNHPDKANWYNNPVTNEQVHQELVTKYLSFPPSQEFASRVCQSNGMMVSRSATAVAHYLSLRAWPTAPVEEFWQTVRDGQADYRDHPAIALRNWALGWATRPSHNAGKKGRQAIEHLVVALRCWNAFCEKQPLAKVGYDVRWQVPKPYRPGRRK